MEEDSLNNHKINRLKKLWQNKRKVLIIIVSNKVVWTIALFVVLYFCLNLIFGNLLKRAIEKSSDYTYEFNYDKFHYNFFTNKVIFKEVSLQSKQATDTVKLFKSVDISSIYLKGFSLCDFFIDKEIFFKELTINGVTVFLNTTKLFQQRQIEQDTMFQESLPDSSQKGKIPFFAKKFFQEHAKKFGVEKFDFQNGNFYLNNADDSLQNIEINNFNLLVKGILITDSILEKIDSVFFFEDFEFSFGKNQWRPQNSNSDINIGFDTLYYSSKNKTTVAENLNFQSMKESETIDVKASYFSVQNIDFEQILNSGKISPDTLTLSNTNLKLNIVEKSNKKESDSSGFEKFLQHSLPISFQHIALIDNHVDLNYHAFNQPNIHINTCINLYLDDFELNKTTFKDKINQLLCDHYYVHLSDAQIHQEGIFETTLTNLTWGTKDNSLLINNVEYCNLKDKGLKSLQFEIFQLKELNISKMLKTKDFEARLLYVKKGNVVLENEKKHVQKHENQSLSFDIPQNKYLKSLYIESVDINDVNFESSNYNKKIASIRDIDLNINRLKVHPNKRYFLFDFKFCKNISGGTGGTNINLNDNIHVLSWNSLSTDFDKKIQFKDFSINTNSDPQKLLKELVILPPTLIQAQSEIVEITKFNFGWFFKYGMLDIESIYSQNSNIQIYKTEFASVKKKSLPFSAVNIESIIFEDGKFSLTDSNFFLSFNDYMFNIDILNIPAFNGENTNYKFSNLIFEYQQQNLKMSNISLFTNDVKLNHQKNIFEIDHLLFDSEQDEKPLQNLHVDLNQLTINYFDFLSLIYDKVFYANDLTIASSKISCVLNSSYKLPKNTEKAVWLQQLLIRNVIFPDIQLDFSIIDKKQSHHHLTFNRSDLEMKQMNWSPDMNGFPHKGKMKMNLRNLIADIDNQEKRTTIDSLTFSLSPDLTNVYGIYFNNKKDEEVLSSFNCQKIMIIAPDMDEIVTNNHFKSDKLLINNGEITLDITHIKQQKAKENPLLKDTTSANKKIRNLINDLFNQVVLNDIRLKLVQEGQMQTVSLKNGILDEKNGSTLTIDALNFKVNNKLADAGFKKILINTKNKRIFVDSCYLTPVLSKEEWANYFDYQKDWTKISAKSVILEGINIEEFLGKTHYVPLVRINQLKLEDYRDKRKPFPENHFPPMPQKMLNNIPRPFLIDSIIVTSSDFLYEEQVEYALHPGKVFFTDARIQVGHITNSPDYVKDFMKVNCSMNLMDSAKLTAQLSFSLNDSTNYFTASAQLEPFNMQLLNPTLENLAFLSIKDGICNGLEMNFHGTNIYSLGSMQFMYQDFKIGLIDKKKLKSDAGSNFLSFLANTFVVRRSNPTTIFPRNGIIYFERDPHKSIFNYLFKSSLMGVKHTIGLRESKATKDKHSKNYINYEQERKDIIKNYKIQKKEERKAIKNSHKEKKGK